MGKSSSYHNHLLWSCYKHSRKLIYFVLLKFIGVVGKGNIFWKTYMYRLAHGTFSNNLDSTCMLFCVPFFLMTTLKQFTRGKFVFPQKYILKYFSNFVISYKYNTKWALSNPEVHKLWNTYVQNRHNTFPTDPNLRRFFCGVIRKHISLL